MVAHACLCTSCVCECVWKVAPRKTTMGEDHVTLKPTYIALFLSWKSTQWVDFFFTETSEYSRFFYWNLRVRSIFLLKPTNPSFAKKKAKNRELHERGCSWNRFSRQKKKLEARFKNSTTLTVLHGKQNCQMKVKISMWECEEAARIAMLSLSRFRTDFMKSLKIGNCRTLEKISIACGLFGNKHEPTH